MLGFLLVDEDKFVVDPAGCREDPDPRRGPGAGGRARGPWLT